MVQFIDFKDGPTREEVIAEIKRRLEATNQTLSDAIRERELYFRVSVVGACNLSCTFCHNEGAPTIGKMTAADIDSAICAAVSSGFTRVQFTGGEPLLHPLLDKFIEIARTYVDDVGVTTNGTYLPKRLDGLVASGLQRLHVSLQTETLIEAGSEDEWGIPDWLQPTVERARRGEYFLRFNLPVPSDAMEQAERFLVEITAGGVSVKVFSILPEGELTEESYPLASLEAIVGRLEVLNRQRNGSGRVELRGYRPPVGLRCGTCGDRERCKEQSHSLRLGSDLVLRPCLATRDWDLSLKRPLEKEHLLTAVRESALLALDYQW